MYFSVSYPQTDEIPVVVEVPHAGLFVDPQSLATLVAPARSLGRDADLYVDQLFADAPDLGATLLSANVSRSPTSGGLPSSPISGVFGEIRTRPKATPASTSCPMGGCGGFPLLTGPIASVVSSIPAW